MLLTLLVRDDNAFGQARSRCFEKKFGITLHFDYDVIVMFPVAVSLETGAVKMMFRPFRET